MWELGSLKIQGKVVLAPMAGISCLSYRKFMNNFGVSLSFTEMVSDCGIIYNNSETLKYLKHDDDVHPIGLQLFGSDVENLKKAVSIIKNNGFDFDFIDINMGCPVPKVTKPGAGSALLKDPKKCGEIVRSLKSIIDVPISIKIRLGWDDNSLNFMDVIEETTKAGVDLISIHARTTKQLYSGAPYFEKLKDLRTKMTVPLVVSGNIFTLDDAINALEISKADGVMVARGGIGNPWLIKQIDHYFKTGERLPDCSLKEKCEQCLALAKLMCLEKGEYQALRIFRSIGPLFFKSFPHSKGLRNSIARDIETFEDLKREVNNFLTRSENVSI